MNPEYLISDTSTIYTPALIFYKDIIRRNIAQAIAVAGGVDRLRPHVKTHKTREIVRMELDAGIRKHKCATIAEAEMLAECGVLDVLLAYPMVGPNCRRFARLVEKFPGCAFSVIADHPGAVRSLAAALPAIAPTFEVPLAMNTPQHRT